MSLQDPQNNNGNKYDLGERTAVFAEQVIVLAKLIPKNQITKDMITQLVNAATSIAANYCEADSAESRKDFEHKLGICKKESKETRLWLRLVVTAAPELKEHAEPLWKEADELLRIFITIVKKSKENGSAK
jgi:four helix bundle protein